MCKEEFPFPIPSILLQGQNLIPMQDEGTQQVPAPSCCPLQMLKLTQMIVLDSWIFP